MNWVEYSEAAMAFCNPQTAHRQDVAFFGLVSELGELAGLLVKIAEGKHVDDKDVLAEIGDAMWRLAHFGYATFGENAGVEEVAGKRGSMGVARSPDNLAAMRVVLSGLTPAWRGATDRVAIYAGLCEFAQWYGGWSPDDVFQANLSKLRARHGTKWAAHDQQNRDPEPEPEWVRVPCTDPACRGLQRDYGGKPFDVAVRRGREQYAICNECFSR